MPEILEPQPVSISAGLETASGQLLSDQVIPAGYRRIENLHIVFWLVKDISWCMFWKPLGLAMIAPTLAIALVLARRTRKNTSEFAHNLAIIIWILANSYWMISEFAGIDEKKIWLGLEGKYFAIIPFVLGMAVLANYYLWQPALKKINA